ncbi:MAG: beta-glucuronidase [Sphaerochaeta sp.]|nr:beta-glucuronidase [Sphaerochaeta sp.]
MLYPQNSRSRLSVPLDGIWQFKLLDAPHDAGQPLAGGCLMPVPSSYNDIYEGREMRDHVAQVVYERTFFLPPIGGDRVALLRFDSVTHHGEVYLNGMPLGSHKGGFLPFEFDVTDRVDREQENRLTVVVDNILDHTTLPVGTVEERTFPAIGTRRVNLPNFDFFNYSGIHRPVTLNLLPRHHISDITFDGRGDGSFTCRVECGGESPVEVSIKDGDRILWSGVGREHHGTVDSIIAWDVDEPKLYDLEVVSGEDSYTLAVGFRSVETKRDGLYLNGRRVYLKGFGKHEDSPVGGRRLDQVYNVKDLALMKWMGANSLRTCHYPYSEQFLDLCDRMGILVIGETSAVGMHTTFTATGMKIDVHTPTWQTLATASHHRDVIRDMIARDKNHPCIIMWSIANEPASEEAGARNYFEPLFALARELDPHRRPVTFATHGEASWDTCEVAPLCDVLMLNRYFGWYHEEGNIEVGAAMLRQELDCYHETYPNLPIMLGEFGADAVAGLHDSTPTMFSEEFQRDLIAAYCAVLDAKEYIFGEHVWNFADFATAESVKRVQGNKKGVFTRERKPKMCAWYLKDRWGRENNGNR